MLQDTKQQIRALVQKYEREHVFVGLSFDEECPAGGAVERDFLPLRRRRRCGASRAGRILQTKVLQISARSVSRLAFPWAMSLALDGRGDGVFACFPRAYLLYYYIRSFASHIYIESRPSRRFILPAKFLLRAVSPRDVFLFHRGGCYVPIVDRAQTTIGMHPDQLFVCTPYHYSIECGWLLLHPRTNSGLHRGLCSFTFCFFCSRTLCLVWIGGRDAWRKCVALAVS